MLTPFRRAANLAADTLNQTIIRIAVTGLSRSGKTVFLTSLIANLLALGGGRNTLPALTAQLSRHGLARLPSVRLLPAGAETVPRFEVNAKLAAMAAASPRWPDRTEDIAAIALEISVPRTGAWSSRLPDRRIRLEFLDYPGEWLLDLPLLSQDFATWSRETLARLHNPAHATATGEFLAFLAQFDPALAADDAVLRQGHQLYRDCLFRLRESFGLRYLQPGRFLCPGAGGDAPYLWFFPCEAESSEGESACALLAARFAAYKSEIRNQFFASKFVEFDRQIVLVDVLTALHAGPDAFADTETALADIARAFAYGSNGWLDRLVRLGELVLGGKLPLRRIDKVVFACTKADHVPAAMRPNLVNLLHAMAETGAAAAIPGVSYRACASVLSTRDGEDTLQGNKVAVVVGVPEGSAQARGFYAGEIPAGRPGAAWWEHPQFTLPPFHPPRIDASGSAGIPHLGLDEIVLDMIGDRL